MDENNFQRNLLVQYIQPVLFKLIQNTMQSNILPDGNRPFSLNCEFLKLHWRYGQET